MKKLWSKCVPEALSQFWAQTTNSGVVYSTPCWVLRRQAQAYTLLFVEKGNKDALLASLLSDRKVKKAIVFTQMKHYNGLGNLYS